MGTALLAGGAAVVASGISAAINAATGDTHWPGVLDWLRRNPWHFSIGLTLFAAILAGVAAWVQEQPGGAADDPAPPEPADIPEWVIDRAEKRRVVAAVCGRRRTVGITTLLTGAGGFGKTTLAQVVSADRRVQKRFNKRIYTVTIGRDVSGRAAIAAKVAEAARFITGDTSEFDDPDLAGAHLGRLLDTRPRTLLVLDDVWEPEQLAPFLHGGRSCVRLVTTRIPSLLPVGAQAIQVDEMSPTQARTILTQDLPRLPGTLIDDLRAATGRWPLLLRLTNRLITEQVATGATAATAASDMLQRLRDQGPAGVDDPAVTLDLDDPKQRSRAVRATVEAAITLLPPGGRDRFTDLALFAEDEAVPVTLIAALWQATGGLSEPQSRTLCRDMQRLSLLTLTPDQGGRVTLHDVIRDYLRGELGDQALRRLNQQLIDLVAASVPPASPVTVSAEAPDRAWWQLQEPYLLDHLIEHLVAAGRPADAEAVASDVRWVETRLNQRGASAPWSDLSRIPTSRAAAHARPLAQAAHLLTPTDPPHALRNVLYSRLEPLAQWRDQVIARQEDRTLFPLLVNQWAPPDVPDPAFLRALAGHEDWVRSVVGAPDGNWLATGGDDRTVRIWERASGTCVAVLTGHNDWVRSVAIAPDGGWLVSGSDDKSVRVWDWASGTCVAVLVGHSAAVTSVAIAPGGGWLVSGSNDKSVRVWDRASGTCVAVLVGHSAAVTSVAIAPGGGWLVSGSNDKSVRVWDWASGTCVAVLVGHSAAVTSVAIAPGGGWLVSGSNDKSVRVWDWASGTCVAVLVGHSAAVTSVAIAPGGGWLVSGSNDKSVRVWDRANGTCTATLTGHTGGVEGVAVAPDGTWLASGSGDGTVRLWDQVRGNSRVALPGQAGPASSVVFAPDGTWLVTGSEDGTARIWDRASGTCTATFTGLTAGVDALAVAPDGTWLATGSEDGTARIWDRASGTCTATLTGHSRGVDALAVAPDGTWLATGSRDGTARIWDRASGTCTATLTGHSDWIRSVSISSDGTSLTTGSRDGTARTWDRASGVCTATRNGHIDRLRLAAISPDGTWIADCSRDQTVRIWDRTRMRVVTLVRADGAVYACAWADDSRTLAVAGQRGLYLYELRT
ncbi:NB-ARC domain-containing protein [Streptomyces viridiviolaceus]|nr:NB-ARC domain-containing protein [Streptomyces viridiviolaceus]